MRSPPGAHRGTVCQFVSTPEEPATTAWPPHFQVARPLRGEAVAAPVVLVAEESGRCRGVVEGERQESGVGSRGRREEVVDRAGDEVADEHGWRPTPARPATPRPPPPPWAMLAPVAPRAFM